MPLFLIWYADLDEPSAKHKERKADDTIPPRLIGNLTAATDSLYALDKRLKEETDKRREEYDKLNNRIHEVARSQEVIKVTFAVLLTLLIGLALFAVRGELGRWIDLIPPGN